MFKRLVKVEDGATYTWVHQGMFDSQERYAHVTRHPVCEGDQYECVVYDDLISAHDTFTVTTTRHDTYEEALSVAMAWVTEYQ